MHGATTEPFQDECRNTGDGARFTCPGCYLDLPHDAWHGRAGECPRCRREIICTVEHEPTSVCRLAEA